MQAFPCSKCPSLKTLDNFQLMRKGTKHEYRLTYCKDCRSKQINDNYNSDYNKVLKDTFVRLRARCKAKNLPFDLDFEYFQKIFTLQDGKCFYSGTEFSMKRGLGFNPKTCTVDKVIPEKGYVRGNIVFATKRFNSVKYDLSLKELETHIPSWYNKIIETEWIDL